MFILVFGKLGCIRMVMMFALVLCNPKCIRITVVFILACGAPDMQDDHVPFIYVTVCKIHVEGGPISNEIKA